MALQPDQPTPTITMTVCIDALDDGTYSVYTEMPDEDQSGEVDEPGEMSQDPGAAPGGAPGSPPAPPEGDSEEGPEPGAQPAPTLKAALTLAMEALRNGGKMGDDEQQAQGFAQAFGNSKGGM